MKRLIPFLFALAGFFAPDAATAQVDDLMITEYVDWEGGSGYYVKIYNPTPDEIDLSDYCLCQVNNGNLGNSGDCAELADQLLPSGDVFVIGNNTSDCTPDQMNGLIGVNGNDAVILKRKIDGFCDISNLDGVVDMVGNPASDGFPQVAGVAEALKWHRLVRENENCTRYTQADGGARSWPTSGDVDFEGWIVEEVSCLSDTAPFIITGEPLVADAGEDAVTCNTFFQFEGIVTGKADSIAWSQVSGPAQPELDSQTGEISALDTEGEYVFQFVAVNACGQAFADSVTLVIRFGGPLFRSVEKRDAFAGADNGVFILNAFGATPPYRYSIDGQNFQDERIFRGLAPGRYTLYAQDEQGCTSSIEAEIR